MEGRTLMSLMHKAGAVVAAVLRAEDDKGVPDVSPIAPPGVSTTVNTLLGYLYWLGLAAGVAGLLMAGAGIALSNRGHEGLGDKAKPIGYVCLGIALVAGAVRLVRALA